MTEWTAGEQFLHYLESCVLVEAEVTVQARLEGVLTRISTWVAAGGVKLAWLGIGDKMRGFFAWCSTALGPSCGLAKA